MSPAAARFVQPKALADFFLGSLCWSGLALADPAHRLARAAGWYGALVGAGLEGIPFAVVFDLGTLLLEGPATPLGVAEWFHHFPAPERALRARYGAGFLAATTERAWFLRAHDLIAGSEDPEPGLRFALERILRDLNVPRQDGLVLQPARFPQLPWGRLGREVADEAPLQRYRTAAQTFANWAEADLARPELEAFLARAAMRGGRDLMGELDFFELNHLDKLPTRERRLAARQLRRAELLLGDLDLSALGSVREAEEVDVELPDEGTYPSGGLGGLANRGSWENLVPSELVYMGEPGETDLFAVRLAEGELLFYTRDGGILRRRRRRVHLVLELDDSMRVKFPSHPLSVDRLLEGLCARLAADLLEAFDGDACEILIHVLGSGAEECAGLLKIRFDEEGHRGEVQVRTPDRVDPAAWSEPTRRNYCVWISAAAPLDVPQVRDLETARVRAVAVRVGARESDEAGVALPVNEDLVLSLGEVRDLLVARLLGARH